MPLLLDDGAVRGIREEAAAALVRIAVDQPAVTNALLAVLADDQDQAHVRAKCAWCLHRVRPTQDKVIAALTRAAQGEGDAAIRRQAIRALADIGPEAKVAIEPLIAVLEDKSPHADVRGAAIDGVAKSCPQAKRAVTTLVQALSDWDRDVRETAVRALATVEPDIAVPPLIQALKESCEEAEDGLRRIGKPAVPALVELLLDPDSSIRARAAKSLAPYDYLAADALPALQDACRDSSPHVRCMAVRALGWIGVASPEVMRSLCQALKDPDSKVRQEAASSLYCLVEQATPPASVVVSALQETDPGMLHWLVNTVYVGEMAEQRILPLLRKHLDHPNRGVRQSTVRALRIFGAAASAAVPKIIEVAVDGSDWERGAAMQTLAEIGVSRDQAERLWAQHFFERELQEGDSGKNLMVEAMLHLLVPHSDLAERFLSQHPEVIYHLRVTTAESLRMQQGDEFSTLKRAIFDDPNLPAPVILAFRDPQYIPTLKEQMKRAHPHRRSYLAAVARVLGEPPDRVVKISETEPGDFRPDASDRIGSALQGHADGFSEVLVTGRIILKDGTPAPRPRFFEGNDRMLLGRSRREPRPVEYDSETGRFVFQTNVFAAYSLGPDRDLGPYMTGPAVVLIEAADCKPLSVVFYDEMPDVEITLSRQSEAK